MPPYGFKPLVSVAFLEESPWVGGECFPVWIYLVSRLQNSFASPRLIPDNQQQNSRKLLLRPPQFLHWKEFPKLMQCMCLSCAVLCQYACKHPFSEPAHRDSSTESILPRILQCLMPVRSNRNAIWRPAEFWQKLWSTCGLWFCEWSFTGAGRSD